MDIGIQLFSALAGSLGFAMLYNLRGTKLFYAGLGGLFSWGLYLGIQAMTGSSYGSCIAAMALATAYAELLARKEKTPVTVFLGTAAIPLVPGGALYQAMDGLLMKNWEQFVDRGSYALLFASSIAAGILIGTLLFENAMRFSPLFRKGRV